MLLDTSELVRTKNVSRLVLISLVVATFVFMASGVAFANYGPHGAFVTDTDACAGCHRAHTSVSNVKFEDRTLNRDKSALLAGSNLSFDPTQPGNQGQFVSATVKDFCYTCHGAGSAGAATDVMSGVLESAIGNSTAGDVLNGGGFVEIKQASVTSMHDMPSATAASQFVAGGGLAFGGRRSNGTYDAGGGLQIVMDCDSCHDPHGSSNYRILKDKVNGVAVGGYGTNFANETDPNPDPYVLSNEVGFPLPSQSNPNGGFRLHVAAAGYSPDYTTARYAKAPAAGKGISGWCAACHTEYNTTSSTNQTAYNAGDGLGDVVRHRHPVNVPLNGFVGDRDLLTTTTATGMNAAWGDNLDIPLEHSATAEAHGATQPNSTADNIGCLTCHRAHGTDKTMAGYAAGVDPYNNTMAFTPPSMGTNGASNSAILRANNRGVCERCHNK
jgi:predicted CXXCH cytochrome family protein